MNAENQDQAKDTTTETSAPASTVGKGARAAKAKAKRPSKPVVTKGTKAAEKTTKPAKKAKAKKPVDVSGRLVPADLTEYTVDKEHRTANGNPSVHCGDDMAKLLLGKDLDQVYKIAAAKLKEPEADLRKRYKTLNVGMQRMNLGNRIRGALA